MLTGRAALLGLLICVLQAQAEETRSAPADSSLGSAQQTADSVPLLPDSLRALRGASSSDSLPQPRTTTAPADSFRFWHHPYWGLGISWTLGSSPLFESWQAPLPSKLAELGLPGTLVPTDTSLIDTAKVRLTQVEQASTYNIDFPVSVCVTPLATQRHSVKLDAAFAFQYKRSDLVVRADSLDGQLALRQSLGLYMTSVGATYTLGIPAEYFSIDNTVRTAMTAGIGLLPFCWLNRSDELEIPRGTSPDLRGLADSLHDELHPAEGYGFGFSWMAGMSALKQLGERNGVNVTICYTGRWMTFPELTKGELLGSTASGSQLSAMVHRFAVTFEALLGKRPPEPDEPSAAAPDSTSSPEQEPAGGQTEEGCGANGAPPAQCRDG